MLLSLESALSLIARSYPNQASDALDRQNAIFDESGHFLIYCTMLGVKVVNLVTNKVSRVLGRHENVRFLHATLFQASASCFFTTSGKKDEAGRFTVNEVLLLFRVTIAEDAIEFVSFNVPRQPPRLFCGLALCFRHWTPPGTETHVRPCFLEKQSS